MINNTQRLIVHFKTIEACAKRVGLVVASSLSRRQLEVVMKKEEPHLIAWQKAGYAGDMKYMLRPPSLICNPEELLPQYQSIVCFFANYRNFSNTCVSKEHAAGYGRISAYATGADYHGIIKKRIDYFIDEVRNSVNAGDKINARIFCDAVPSLERAIAAEDGRGFIGKNSMFIKPGLGSFGFLGEVIWNVEIEYQEDFRAFFKIDGCRACSRCVKKCPTGAIIKDRVIDANRCISYKTIEKKGYLAPIEARQIGSWLFGCDECQLCCPYNNDLCPPTNINEFSVETRRLSLSLIEVLGLSEETFLRKFEKTAIMRAGRELLVRNACIVAANTSFVEAIPQLVHLNLNDPSEIVRQQSAAALEILQAIK